MSRMSKHESKSSKNISGSRHRNFNFSNHEKRLLIRYIKQEIEFIENKNVDTHSNELKIQAWERVASKFNSHREVHQRDYECLKTAWRNLKNKVKKEVAAFSENSTESVALILNKQSICQHSQLKTDDIEQEFQGSDDSSKDELIWNGLIEMSKQRLRNMDLRRQQNAILYEVKIKEQRHLLEAAELKALREKEKLRHERNIRSKENKTFLIKYNDNL